MDDNANRTPEVDEETQQQSDVTVELDGDYSELVGTINDELEATVEEASALEKERDEVYLRWLNARYKSSGRAIIGNSLSLFGKAMLAGVLIYALSSGGKK